MGGVIAGVIAAILLIGAVESGMGDPKALEELAFPIFWFASAFAVLAVILTGLSWGPMERTEERLVPRLSDIYRQDSRLKQTRLYLLLFPLITLLFTIELIAVRRISPDYILGTWLILAGIAIDALRHLSQRITHYFSPFSGLELMSARAQYTIKEDRQGELYDAINSLTETALKAEQQGIPSLCNAALDECHNTIKHYFRAAKSIVHRDVTPTDSTIGNGDEAGFTLFFMLQRLSAVEKEALNRHSELVTGHLIGVLGKMIVEAAKYDLTLVDYPLHEFGKFALEAQKRRIGDAGIRATLTLVEVAKTILNEVKIEYQEIKSCFIGIISYLEELAQESFRQDKSTPIAILLQPFLSLQEAFSQPLLQNHQDLEVIQRANANVIAQFRELEVILQTRPSVSDITREALEGEVPTGPI